MNNLITKTIFLTVAITFNMLPLLAQGPGGPPRTPIDGGLPSY